MAKSSKKSPGSGTPQAQRSPTGAALDPRQPIRTIDVRGERVMLDRDVAEVFDVETRALNQQVSRNAAKFGDDFAFRLTKEEIDALRSEGVISKAEWGGTRYPPLAFTEHGVVMAATLLKSPRAIAATRVVISTFVSARRAAGGESGAIANPDDKSAVVLPADVRTELMRKVGEAIASLLDAMINPEEIRKARAEARGVLAESMKGLKEILKKPTLENELKAAEIRKLMAEAESIEVETDGKRMINEERELAALAKKLSLVLQAQRAAETGSPEEFLRIVNAFEDQKRLEGK
ncbi:MAG: ORF6N domain-containing protein [Pseudomonadota bacterium]